MNSISGLESIQLQQNTLFRSFKTQSSCIKIFLNESKHNWPAWSTLASIPKKDLQRITLTPSSIHYALEQTKHTKLDFTVLICSHTYRALARMWPPSTRSLEAVSRHPLRSPRKIDFMRAKAQTQIPLLDTFPSGCPSHTVPLSFHKRYSWSLPILHQHTTLPPYYNYFGGLYCKRDLKSPNTGFKEVIF